MNHASSPRCPWLGLYGPVSHVPKAVASCLCAADTHCQRASFLALFPLIQLQYVRVRSLLASLAVWHVAAAVLIGRFTPSLHHTYSLFYIIGTAGALCGPARYLVGWQPFQSLEQLGPLAIFFGLQVRIGLVALLSCP